MTLWFSQQQKKYGDKKSAQIHRIGLTPLRPCGRRFRCGWLVGLPQCGLFASMVRVVSTHIDGALGARMPRDAGCRWESLGSQPESFFWISHMSYMFPIFSYMFPIFSYMFPKVLYFSYQVSLRIGKTIGEWGSFSWWHMMVTVSQANPSTSSIHCQVDWGLLAS